MSRKKITTLIFLGLIAIFLYDFIVNGFYVFENYFDAPRFKRLPVVQADTPYASRKDEIIIDRENVQEFQLYNPYGKVVVLGEEREDIKIDSEITIFAAEEEQAQAYLTKVKVDKNKNGNTLEVYITPDESQSEEFWGMKVDYIVRVPRDLDLKIDAYIFLRVDNIQGDINLRNSGSTTISKVDGSVVLGLNHGFARVSDINGRVEVGGSFTNYRYSKDEQAIIGGIGDLMLEDVIGDTFFYVQNGRIVLRKIVGNISGESSYGSLEAVDIDGKITYRGRYVQPNLSDVSGKIKILSSYGDIVLRNVQDSVDVYGSFADIEVISELEHKINAETHYGDIIFDIQEPEIIEKNFRRYYRGTIGDGEYDMKLKTRYGDINFKTKNN